MRNVVAFVVLALMGLVAFMYWRHKPEPISVPQPVEPLEDRIPYLKERLVALEKESEIAVADYQPTKGNDQEVWSRLPYVVNAEVKVANPKPTHRIIHVRDWHYVTKELFDADMKDAYKRDLTAGELDQLYQEHLLDVELVQLEQMAMLRCLIKHHGLKTVYKEGFTKEDIAAFQMQIGVLRDMEKKEIPELRQQLETVRKLKSEQAREIEQKLETLLADHTLRLLEVGAAARLLISGELETVLPLDDWNTLDQAKPTANRLTAPPDKIEARHEAILKNLGTTSVIFLGGSHDLSPSIKKANLACDYMRVTTKRVKLLSN